jgi:hypothetical protein
MLGKLPAIGGQFRMGDFANDAPALVMRSATTSLGMQRRQGSFEWILEPKAAADFRDKVQVLAEANSPGHQDATQPTKSSWWSHAVNIPPISSRREPLPGSVLQKQNAPDPEEPESMRLEQGLLLCQLV